MVVGVRWREEKHSQTDRLTYGFPFFYYTSG